MLLNISAGSSGSGRVGCISTSWGVGAVLGRFVMLIRQTQRTFLALEEKKQGHERQYLNLTHADLKGSAGCKQTSILQPDRLFRLQFFLQLVHSLCPFWFRARLCKH